MQSALQSKEDYDREQRDRERESREAERNKEREEAHKRQCAKMDEVIAAVVKLSIEGKPHAPVLAPAADEQEVELAAWFVRARLANEYPFADMLDAVFKVAGRESYEVESDFLFEISVVNKTDTPVTVDKYVAETQIAGEWITLPQITGCLRLPG
jgi:hypothetical protein